MSTDRERRRVLVVDDDPDIVTLVKDLLEAEGYEALDAPDGLEGILAGTYGEPFDLVILDVMMPLADGIGVLNALKTVRPGVPILMLSAKASREDVAEGYRWGCDGYVTKPFEPERLLAEVQRLIGVAEAA
ncbi:MAG TPA: response regulator [Planctomycetota bacterium]|nr:response regulator [Planctomycetota bacterium]